MKYLFIGTTAITRPVLHTYIFKEWLEWIDNLSDEWNISWFINIDYIEHLNKSYDETLENFKKISIPRIELIFLKQKSANFFNACKRISKKIKKKVEKNNLSYVKIFWLEDDWKLNSELIKELSLEVLLNKYLNGKHIINFTCITYNYLWALAPSVMSYELFIDIFYDSWNNNCQTESPEHCAGIYCLKKYGRMNNLYNMTIISTNINNDFFSDINNNYLNLCNSFYTFYNMKYYVKNINETKYIQKIFFENLPVFMRIYPNLTIDGCNYGRKFMENVGLTKKKGIFIYEIL